MWICTTKLPVAFITIGLVALSAKRGSFSSPFPNVNKIVPRPPQQNNFVKFASKVSIIKITNNARGWKLRTLFRIAESTMRIRNVTFARTALSWRAMNVPAPIWSANLTGLTFST